MVEIARFKSSYEGVGLMLNMPEIAAVLKERAERVRQEAEATAPVDKGTFKDSFETDIEKRGGGLRHDRPKAIVRSTDPAGIYIEKGTGKTEAHHTLLQALFKAAR